MTPALVSVCPAKPQPFALGVDDVRLVTAEELRQLGRRCLRAFQQRRNRYPNGGATGLRAAGATRQRIDQCSGQSIAGASAEPGEVPVTALCGAGAPVAAASHRSQRMTPLNTHMMQMKVPQSLHG